jgi:hypothetical protein
MLRGRILKMKMETKDGQKKLEHRSLVLRLIESCSWQSKKKHSSQSDKSEARIYSRIQSWLSKDVDRKLGRVRLQKSLDSTIQSKMRFRV